ncbi:hypothetical protein NDU88_007247 [Pleurodeles waltl]|uniref:Uncharacterized protein n=1 Tax=Pleurodeles waltl TaxID=8319 RepID=A0AAV7U0V9_PLEWA|nr:hypothetical protein NDU88_007247 [Pleurodeles waltl]
MSVCKVSSHRHIPCIKQVKDVQKEALSRKEETDESSVLILDPSVACTTADGIIQMPQAHWIGSLHKQADERPCPKIAFFLRHEQAHQLLTATMTHGPYRQDGDEIRIAADF